MGCDIIFLNAVAFSALPTRPDHTSRRKSMKDLTENEMHNIPSDCIMDARIVVCLMGRPVASPRLPEGNASDLCGLNPCDVLCGLYQFLEHGSNSSVSIKVIQVL